MVSGQGWRWDPDGITAKTFTRVSPNAGLQTETRSPLTGVFSGAHWISPQEWRRWPASGIPSGARESATHLASRHPAKGELSTSKVLLGEEKQPGGCQDPNFQKEEGEDEFNQREASAHFRTARPREETTKTASASPLLNRRVWLATRPRPKGPKAKVASCCPRESVIDTP